VSTSGKYLQGRFGTTPASAGWPANGNPAGVRIKGLSEWSCDDSAAELDGTDSESAGYENPDAGISSCTVTIALVVNADEVTYPGAARGALVTDLLLFSNGFNAKADYDIPLGVVLRASPAVQVKGQIRQSVTIKAKGRYAGSLELDAGAAGPRRINPATWTNPDA